MSQENLAVGNDGTIRTITVNRPDKLNALNRATLEELSQAVEQAALDDSVRVLIITGSGDRAFVAGADITEIRRQSAAEAARFSRLGQDLMRRIQHLDKPVIARVNGFALGGGLELALACHLRIASDNARLGLPEIKLGIMPGFGGSQRLARLVGSARALEMMLTGEPVDAETAAAMGLVNHCVAADALDERVQGLASTLAAAAPEGVRGILEAVQRGLDGPLDTGLALETARFAVCCATEDMQEGTAAFLEKRKPEFLGR